MNNIPKKLNDLLNEDPEYKICSARGLHVCGGRITREHALYYAGKQIQMRGAIIPLCAKGHGVDQYQDGKNELPKDMRQWIALNWVDMGALKKHCPKRDWEREKSFLDRKFGAYKTKR